MGILLMTMEPLVRVWTVAMLGICIMIIYNHFIMLLIII